MSASSIRGSEAASDRPSPKSAAEEPSRAEEYGGQPRKYHSEYLGPNNRLILQPQLAQAYGTPVKPVADQSDGSSSNSSSNEGPLSSPPPVAQCPHVSFLDIDKIRKRFRSFTFSRSFQQEQMECIDCDQMFTKEHLWACLQCNELNCCRCGRFDMKHSALHCQESRHCLIIHMATRIIWCYACDSEVADNYSTDGKTLAPQLVRQALDKEDTTVDENDDSDRASGSTRPNGANGTGNDVSEPQEEVVDVYTAFRPLYNNANGGQAGLSNLGNTCFFSAGIQALLHCPQLIAFFSYLPSVEEQERVGFLDVHTRQQRENQERRLRLVQDFSNLIWRVWSERVHKVCVPRDLLMDILWLNPFFRGYGQHDSHELVRNFLDNLHDGSKLHVEYEFDLKKKLRQQKEEEEKLEREAQAAAMEAKKPQQGKRQGSDNRMTDGDGPSNSPASSAATSSSATKPPAKKRFAPASIVADLFCGTLESSVRCTNCGHISVTRDPFYDLSLEIPKDQQLKKIGAERGNDALTPQAPRSLFGSLSNYLGLTSPNLNLETCLHSFCLTGDSRITLADGTSALLGCMKRSIKAAGATGVPILTLHDGQDGRNRGFEIGRAVTFLTQGTKECVELKLEDGRTLTCTPDHQILTTNGWVEARELEPIGGPRSHRIICGLEGPVDDSLDVATDVNHAEDTDFCFDLPSFGHVFRMRQNRPQVLAIARILGALASRGSVQTQGGVIEGAALHVDHLLDVSCLKADLRLCGAFGAEPARATKEKRDWYVVPIEAPLATDLARWAGCSGGKPLDQTLLPEFVRSPATPLAVVREFMAAYFGGKGEAPQPNCENDWQPVRFIVHSSTSQSAQDEARDLLHQMRAVLSTRFAVAGSEFWVKSIVNEFGDCVQHALLLPRGSSLLFHDRIGMRYSSRKAIRLMAASTYYRAMLAGNHALMCSPAKWIAKIGAEAFFLPSGDDKLDARSTLPFITLGVAYQSSVGNKPVFDISVPATHNFLANGLVVHNCTSDQLLQKDQYKCEKCREKVDAVKTLSLGTGSDLPEILCLHIKRFSHNSYFGSKISRHVIFPLHNLDMAPFLSQKAQPGVKRAPSSSFSSPPILYDLFAIIRHLGGVSGGHYISYAKNHVTGKWYEFDDKIVTEKSDLEIAKIEAYCLFYQRKHPPEPLQRILKQLASHTVAGSATAPVNSGNVRYVSKHWIKKMEILGRPEPIDNRDLCCPHGLPKPIALTPVAAAIPLSVQGWEQLFAEYGGGPIVSTVQGTPCEVCSLPVVRKQERERIQAADAQAARCADTDPFYLIHAGWLQSWRDFITQNQPRPGPISNHLLLLNPEDASNPSGGSAATPVDPSQGVHVRDQHGEYVLQAKLKRGDDYRALHFIVWNELVQMYGVTGPVIERPTSDIYVSERPPAQTQGDDDEDQNEE